MSTKTLPKLGRGVDALFAKKGFIGAGKSIIELPINEIKTNEYQPRKHFSDEALRDLAHSVKENGLAQPILVRRLEDDSYELIAGERRLRACKLAGFERIPTIIRQVTDKQSLLLALVENLDREDLNAIEEAEGYQRLIAEFSHTHQEVAQLFGKSRSAISNSLRLLQLPAEIKRLLFEATISEGHARVLLALPNVESQYDVLNKVLKQGMSVRETEQLISALLANNDDTSRKNRKKTNDANAQRRLSAISYLSDMGFKVTGSGSDEKGKITLNYKSPDELSAILQRLGCDA